MKEQQQETLSGGEECIRSVGPGDWEERRQFKTTEIEVGLYLPLKDDGFNDDRGCPLSPKVESLSPLLYTLGQGEIGRGRFRHRA